VSAITAHANEIKAVIAIAPVRPVGVIASAPSFGFVVGQTFRLCGHP
jgi:hypothetical protein